MGLEHGDDLGQTLVTHVLQHTQHTGLEEDLGGTQAVLGGVQLQGSQDLVRHLSAIHEALRDGVGSQDGVSVQRTSLHCTDVETSSHHYK